MKQFCSTHHLKNRTLNKSSVKIVLERHICINYYQIRLYVGGGGVGHTKITNE